MITAISLGAGVQSTTMALMAAHGEITPMPDMAIFADTGNEKRATYTHLDWLDAQLPFPIVRVRRYGNLDLGTATVAHYRAEPHGLPYSPPFYSDQGKLPTFCSKEWKTRAISGYLRSLFDIGPGERMPKDARAESWIGISTDEAHRMKSSEAKWITNRWPLIEMRRHRGECEPWLTRHGYPLPPRSACVFCPHQGDKEWAEMSPIDFTAACDFDDAIRDGGNGTTGPLYVSRHMRPLRDVDFAAIIAAKQQPDLFGEECEGVCGV